MRLLVLLAACANPLPLPPSDADYCDVPRIMPYEEWRILCGQRPRELELDGGR